MLNMMNATLSYGRNPNENFHSDFTGSTSFEIDEHARPDATIESMTKLPPVFKKGGTVTAANASGVCDGASAVILASEEAVAKHNLKPLARLVG